MNKTPWFLMALMAVSLLTAAGCAKGSPQAAAPTPQIDRVTEGSQLMATSTTSTTALEATSTEEFLASSSTALTAEDSKAGEEQCLSLGGKLVALDAPTGRWEACYFSDKSLCEIQSLRLGDCHRGACHEVCLNARTGSEGLYDSCSGLLIRKAHCAK